MRLLLQRLRDLKNRGTAEMSTEQWLDVVHQAAEWGVGRIDLTGGEPTLHPGFRAIAEECVKRDIQPFFATNGYTVTPEFAAWAKELGLPFLQFSFDTPDAAEFDALTRRPGSFEKVLESIRLMTEAGIRVVIKAVLMPQNFGRAMELVELMDRAGVTRLSLERFDLSACGRGNTDMLVTDEMLSELSDKVEAWRREHRDRKMMLSSSRSKLCWKDKYDLVSCGAFYSSMILMPNGDVSACEKMIGIPEVVAGNVREQTLKEIWDSDRLKAIIWPDESRYSEACRTCSVFHDCRSGCYSLKHTLGQDLYAVDPRCFRAGSRGNPFRGRV